MNLLDSSAEYIRVYKPDDVLNFRSMSERWEVIQEMRRIFDDFVDHGISEDQALFAAFKKLFLGDYAHLCTMHPNEWMARIEGMLMSAESILRSYYKIVPRGFRNRLETHSSLKMNYRPVVLLKMSTGHGLTKDSDLIDRRKAVDAVRNLMLAFQAMQIEITDSSANVGDDLRTIDELSYSSGLFLRDESREIIVVAERQSTTGYILQEHIKLFTADQLNDAREYYHAKKKEKLYMYMQAPLICRVAKSGGKTWIVNTDSRGKELKSTIRRLEAGRNAKDRRALRYVVVATENADGKFTVATRKDAIDFHKYVEETLWESNELLLSSKSRNNAYDELSNRHEHYWSIQTEGRIIVRRECDKARPIWSSQCENQIMDISCHIDANNSHTEVNHDWRRAKQIYSAVLALYWPDHGIDWGDDGIRKSFEEYWMTRYGVSQSDTYSY